MKYLMHSINIQSWTRHFTW